MKAAPFSSFPLPATFLAPYIEIHPWTVSILYHRDFSKTQSWLCQPYVYYPLTALYRPPGELHKVHIPWFGLGSHPFLSGLTVHYSYPQPYWVYFSKCTMFHLNSGTFTLNSLCLEKCYPLLPITLLKLNSSTTSFTQIILFLSFNYVSPCLENTYHFSGLSSNWSSS